MGLQDVFIAAVEIAFQTFVDLVRPGIYKANPSGSGWEDGDDVPIDYPMEVIVNGLGQKDLKNTKFYAQILETDTVIMVRGTDIAKMNNRVRKSDGFEINHGKYIGKYSVEAHDTDPAEALFLLLLREK